MCHRVFRGGKQEVADLSESHSTGGSVMEGRNRLQIYLKAKEQGVQVWKEVKEQIADLSECRGTGVQERKEQVADLYECRGTGVQE